MRPVVGLQDLSKHFIEKGRFGRPRKIIKAVDRVDLSIAPGEKLGLVGESGSGKTTLGRLILRLYDPDGGRVILDGKDITKVSQRSLRPQRWKMQVVFQDPYSSLDPRFSVRRILNEAFFFRKEDRSSRADVMAGILRDVGLSAGMLDRYPHEFSGGERQRIAIARAMIARPQLLILDEAVSSLDVLVQEQILQLLDKLHEQHGPAYLFITHNLRVVRKLCQKVAVMYNGRIVELAPAEELFQNPLHPYTRDLLAAAIEYRSATNSEYSVDENSRLIDKGNGHFVIN